ncbi:hypothetical protein RchiOBHm_Chr2g0110381 [Rosa chinensis]|uniref:Uncharacterized protein n=1 Tax=Rosa chinensis TaxID=74649 RepID=A0A2P6RPP6_ROSCH|nr:hypothetical protein RchiOBHm_Chr2g0110381 [Rosa chinensis]
MYWSQFFNFFFSFTFESPQSLSPILYSFRLKLSSLEQFTLSPSLFRSLPVSFPHQIYKRGTSVAFGHSNPKSPTAFYFSLLSRSPVRPTLES